MHRLFTLLLLLIYLLPVAHAQRIVRAVPDTIRPDTLAAPAQSDSIANDSLALVADTLEDAHMSALTLAERCQQLLQNDIFERTQVGIYVYDLTADTLVFAYGDRQCMRPASNEKLVTSITALHALGTDYHLTTRFYATDLPRPVATTDSLATDSAQQATFAGRIYVRAGYDPLLSRDDLVAFADSLKARGITTITSPIAFDLSMKDDKRMGWGWCWDDDEVPLTPLLYDNRDTFAQHLRQTLRECGITWDGTTTQATVPAQATLICQRSHTIDQLLLPMMKRSDNSMAEALFYQIAAHSGTKRAGRKQAVSAVNQLIRALGLNPDHYQIADGSGLSLYNYLTPQLLGQLLRYAYKHETIYRHLLPSLPVAATDGTLRKRCHGTAAAGNVQAKTGTVEGVSTLSGYLTTARGNRLCFSIMNQGIRHTSTGRRFQDRLVTALCQ